MKSSSLRSVLLYPLALVMLFLACSVIWTLHSAGKQAADEISQRLMVRQLELISHVTLTHLSHAKSLINAVIAEKVSNQPDTGARVVPLPDDIRKLEDRLWLALGLFDNTDSSVYFAKKDGAFIGLHRVNKGQMEFSTRESGPGKNLSVYSAGQSGQHNRQLWARPYEPRERPWYRLAEQTGKSGWSPVYADFKTNEPTITLSVPVYKKNRSLLGVAGADIPLRQITDFLTKFKLRYKAVAYIMEPSGALIATTVGELPFGSQGNTPMRLHASASMNEHIRLTYQQVLNASRELEACSGCEPTKFLTVSDDFRVGVTNLSDPDGIHWAVAVVIPKSAYSGNITNKTFTSVAIAAALILLAFFIGFRVLERVVNDVRNLAIAVDQYGRGHPVNLPEQFLSKELSRLAQSFETMQKNLQTDRLTGLLNKESLMAQIEYRRQNPQVQAPRFAILFIDLDRFKLINDTHGHDSGDVVLKEVAHRLKRVLRNSDIVARLGGDEFAVYLHGIASLDTVNTIIDKIRDAVAAPIALPNGVSDYVGASIGAALYPDDGMDVASLFATADSRMYEFKKENKGAR